MNWHLWTEHTSKTSSRITYRRVAINRQLLFVGFAQRMAPRTSWVTNTSTTKSRYIIHSVSITNVATQNAGKDRFEVKDYIFVTEVFLLAFHRKETKNVVILKVRFAHCLSIHFTKQSIFFGHVLAFHQSCRRCFKYFLKCVRGSA